MKSLSVLLLLLIPFNNKTAISEQIVTHDIESINLYLNSAEITRNTQVTIPEGKSDLIFCGISSKILEQGLKVHISDNVKVYAVNIEENVNFYKTDSDWETILVKINDLKSKKKLIEIEQNILIKESSFLEYNMKIGGANGSTFEELDNAAIYFRDKIKSLQIKLYKQKSKLNSLIEKENVLKLEKEKIKKNLDKINTKIRITVINEVETFSTIKLKYLVSNAIWKPTYSIRATSKNQDIILDYQAQLYNDTGNDWIDKPITLAVIDPSDDVSKPNMKPWVLTDDYSYNKSSGEGKLSNSKGNYQASNQNIEYDYLHVDDLSTRFELNDLYKIPSDATPHLIDVKRYVKNADFYTLSIPKIKEGAFIVASIPDWESMNLLDGQISLYYNDTFQGNSKLDTQQVENKLDISLGRDNSFSITRRKLSNMSSEKLIGMNITEVLTYEFIIKNNKNRNADIELRDQLPLAVDKSVEVKPLEISNAKINIESSQLTWKVKFKPNESKKIILKFSVKYPKKKRGLFMHNRKNLKSPRFF